MSSVPIFGENRAFRLPRLSLLLRQLLPRRMYAAPEERRRLTPVFSQYGIEPSSPVYVQGGGKRNESWKFITAQGKLLLKRYRTTLKPAQITYEHSILDHLERVAFPAPRLVRDRENRSMVEVEGRYYVLYPYLRGYAQFDEYIYYPRQEEWLQDAVGRTLANLHNALEGFVPDGENVNGFSKLNGARARNLDWYLQCLAQAQANRSRLEAGDPLRVLLEKQGGWLGERLQAVSEAIQTVNPERGIIHGDFGPNNMLFRRAKPPVLLDFELARLDWLMVDVVAALSTTCGKDCQHGQMARLLRGYLALRPIPAETLRLLPQVWQFQVLRRAIICCEQYTIRPQASLLVEARRRLDRAEWVGRNFATLAGLANLAEKTAPAQPAAQAWTSL